MTTHTPKTFYPKYCTQAKKLCRMGATDKEIAGFFNISQKLLNAWRNDNPKFEEAIINGRLMADAEVANSLYHRAIGYMHDDTDVRLVNGAVEKTIIKKYYPPDSTAMIFYLKNRQPDKWKEKVEEKKDEKKDKANANNYIIVWPKNKNKSSEGETPTAAPSVP
jgi:hypothetical protein